MSGRATRRCRSFRSSGAKNYGRPGEAGRATPRHINSLFWVGYFARIFGAAELSRLVRTPPFVVVHIACVLALRGLLREAERLPLLLAAAGRILGQCRGRGAERERAGEDQCLSGTHDRSPSVWMRGRSPKVERS